MIKCSSNVEGVFTSYYWISLQ